MTDKKKLYIYQCHREFCGFELNAVVAAESFPRALKLLGWSLDEDTTRIWWDFCGPTTMTTQYIMAEESL